MNGLIITIGLFLGASFRILPSLNRILSSSQQIKFNFASINRIAEEFDIIENNNQLYNKNPNLTFKDSIEFKNLTFCYPDKSEPAIKNLNFSFKKGSKFAIKGRSGSGKSTLINLFLTLIKPTEGEIKVDGITLEPNNLSWLKNIGYVPQEVNLLDDTIEKNIAFGLNESEIEQDKLSKAISSSQLTDFVNNLKYGAKTKVGEKGQMTSGGQKQRIGIARALYHDPSIIIMDESTSSLDLETEKLIMDTIYNLDRSITVMIVSHRASALDRCDKFIDLSKNKNI